MKVSTGILCHCQYIGGAALLVKVTMPVGINQFKIRIAFYTALTLFNYIESAYAKQCHECRDTPNNEGIYFNA